MIQFDALIADERHHNAIRYFYHATNKDKKSQIVNRILEKNVYLAAQCVSTDEPDSEIETKVGKQASRQARDFKNTIDSSNGLLALAELKQFEEIMNIFNSIAKPQAFHVNALSRVLKSADQATYLSILHTFLNYKNLYQLYFAFLEYPSKFALGNQEISVLKELVRKLYIDQKIGFLNIFLTKYDLCGCIEVFFDTKIDKLLTTLFGGSKKHYAFAYSILLGNRYLLNSAPSSFIEKFALKRQSSVVQYAFKLCEITNTYNVRILNEKILKILELRKIEKIVKFLRSGAFKYALNSEDIREKVLHFCKTHDISFNKPKSSINKVRSSGDELKIYFESSRIEAVVNSVFEGKPTLNSVSEVQSFLEAYFHTDSHLVKVFPFEPILEYVAEKSGLGIKDTCSVLRYISHEGYIRSINDFGVDIQPSYFNSLKPIFIHNEQISPELDAELNVYNAENRVIQFKIIGYNSANKRLNATNLELKLFLIKAEEFENRSKLKKQEKSNL